MNECKTQFFLLNNRDKVRAKIFFTNIFEGPWLASSNSLYSSIMPVIPGWLLCGYYEIFILLFEV